MTDSLHPKNRYPNSDAAGRLPKNPVSDATVRKARAYRLDRIRREIAANDCGAMLLYDPMNIRYATDSSNMQVWTLHNAVRYALIFAEGPVILFEYPQAFHLSENLETIDEIRPAITWYYFGAGPLISKKAEVWADSIVGALRDHGGGMRLAVDKCDPSGAFLLQKRGVTIVEGQAIAETAREVKSPEELDMMRWTIAVCEDGMRDMREHSDPGQTENEIWARLHAANIRQGGEWIETRLLASGPRTNPWFHECSDRVMQKGDILAFDSDLVGPYSYCSDISRTWTVGHTPPTDAQKTLYALAREQIEHNMGLLKPGLSFAEFNAKSWPIPDLYVKHCYAVALHGVGLCDEYPSLPCAPNFDPANLKGYDGVFKENSVMCVESFIGAETGGEGVKLEIQVLITPDGARRLDSFPFEDWAL